MRHSIIDYIPNQAVLEHNPNHKCTMNYSVNEIKFPLFWTNGMPTYIEATKGMFPMYTSKNSRNSAFNENAEKRQGVDLLLFESEFLRQVQSVVFGGILYNWKSLQYTLANL